MSFEEWFDQFRGDNNQAFDGYSEWDIDEYRMFMREAWNASRRMML